MKVHGSLSQGDAYMRGTPYIKSTFSFYLIKLWIWCPFYHVPTLNEVMNWVKKLSFRKMNIIIEFIVEKCVQVTFHSFSPFRCQVRNLAPFFYSCPQWHHELGQKNYLFIKRNIIIEFIVQKYAQVTNFTFLVHSVFKLGIWHPFYPVPQWHHELGQKIYFFVKWTLALNLSVINLSGYRFSTFYSIPLSSYRLFILHVYSEIVYGIWSFEPNDVIKNSHFES